MCIAFMCPIGFFGEVFKAILVGQSKPVEVAVKTIKRISNNTKKASFIKEMARLSQLIHPNIIQMYGIVDEGMCSLCSDALIIDPFIILQVLYLSSPQ